MATLAGLKTELMRKNARRAAPATEKTERQVAAVYGVPPDVLRLISGKTSAANLRRTLELVEGPFGLNFMLIEDAWRLVNEIDPSLGHVGRWAEGMSLVSQFLAIHGPQIDDAVRQERSVKAERKQLYVEMHNRLSADGRMILTTERVREVLGPHDARWLSAVKQWRFPVYEVLRAEGAAAEAARLAGNPRAAYGIIARSGTDARCVPKDRPEIGIYRWRSFTATLEDVPGRAGEFETVWKHLRRLAECADVDARHRAAAFEELGKSLIVRPGLAPERRREALKFGDLVERARREQAKQGPYVYTDARLDRRAIYESLLEPDRPIDSHLAHLRQFAERYGTTRTLDEVRRRMSQRGKPLPERAA